jgi:hypothetical protein
MSAHEAWSKQHYSGVRDSFAPIGGMTSPIRQEAAVDKEDRRSNAVADDFINRLAVWAGKKQVRHLQ